MKRRVLPRGVDAEAIGGPHDGERVRLVTSDDCEAMIVVQREGNTHVLNMRVYMDPRALAPLLRDAADRCDEYASAQAMETLADKYAAATEAAATTPGGVQ